jgi:hypothetical protein
MRRPPRPNLLLVEGKTDALVANHLCDWHGVPDYYDYVDYEGIAPLLVALPERVRESGRQRVAVVVDADTDPAGRWASVRDRLVPMGYQPGRSPAAGGVVVGSPDGVLPRVGIWVMPDNASPGMIEHFLQELIVPDDLLLPRARKVVAAIPQKHRRFPAARIPKAEIYTWLAWQDSPGTSFGPAIKQGLLDGNQPPAQEFVAWLRRVFDG